MEKNNAEQLKEIIYKLTREQTLSEKEKETIDTIIEEKDYPQN